MSIIPLQEIHYPSIQKIYQQGIDTKNATFETKAPTWEIWDGKFMKQHRFVAISNNEIFGWAALSSVSSRCVYEGVCEVSVYVSPQASGKGIGTQLLQQLIDDSEAKGIWTLQAGVFPENKASIHLHEKLGFRQVGYREKIAKMDGVWRNTILLERRSTKF